MKLRSDLQIFLLNTVCRVAQKIAKVKLKELEESLIEETASRNAKIVREHFQNVETLDGTFSNIGFWKLKQKLCPTSKDPPMAKMNKHGTLITAPEGLKDLYVEEYKERLKNREMKTELTDVYCLKTELWMSRLEYLRGNKTSNWNIEELDSVLKGLKNNKCMDPVGIINEVFKAGCVGQDLKKSHGYVFQWG